MFSSRNGGFAEFLSRMGRDGDIHRAFPARNFLLDEGVADERYASYGASGGIADHPDYKAWKMAHEAYLAEMVQVPRPDTGVLRTLDPSDPDMFPETFRFIDPSSAFLSSDTAMLLLRVVDIKFIANRSDVAVDTIKTLAEKVIASDWARDASYQELSDVLEAWPLSPDVDARPVFSGYWAELSGLFGDTPALDTADWADELRNRLGLVHLNPAPRSGRPISVIVFRYPIKGIPKLAGAPKNTRPLVAPTVLDSTFSSAFCPSPRGGLTGHTVDFGRDSVGPCREVLHPAIKFEAEHVWRVGEIRTSVTDNMLKDARQWHLMCIRDSTDRPDYAKETDG